MVGPSETSKKGTKMTEKQMGKLLEMIGRTNLANRKKFVGVFEGTKTQLDKIENELSQFEKMVVGWGYKTPKDFLMNGEVIRNPNKRRPRTVITDETRRAIVEDVKSGLLKTREISEKHNVPENSVYNIKSKNGLTRKRGLKLVPPTPPSVPPTDSVNGPDDGTLPIAA